MKRQPLSNQNKTVSCLRYVCVVSSPPRQRRDAFAGPGGTRREYSCAVGRLAWFGRETALPASRRMGGLRDTFAINETRAFADKLEVMAHEIHCEPLSTYAEALAYYADTYAVDALEKHLEQFSGLIERVERSSI